MKVWFTDAARVSLERIGDFIAQDNPERAVSFIAELREKALALSDLPRGFPLVPRYERHGIRRRSHRGYGILYSIEDQGIVVHYFLGPGQEFDRLLNLE